MDTRDKLTEALEVLDAMLSNPRCHKAALRVRALVQSARDEFFSEEDDVAALGQCFPDEPFPAA